MENDANEVLKRLISELRLDRRSIERLSEGYSPNPIGSIDGVDGENYIFRYPLVQLSQDLSKRILEINLDWDEYDS